MTAQLQRPVVVVSYDPEWPAIFKALRDVYRRALGDLATAIEHVGSTAVPGLDAKPIIDIDVVIPSRSRLPEVIARLMALGYGHQGDLGVSGREAFSTGEPRTCLGTEPVADGRRITSTYALRTVLNFVDTSRFGTGYGPIQRGRPNMAPSSSICHRSIVMIVMVTPRRRPGSSRQP